MRLLIAVLMFAGLLAAPPAAVAQSDAAEIEFWQSVKGSESASELEAYLKAYPDGKFAPLARIRLKKLTGGDSASPDSAKAAASSDARAQDTNAKSTKTDSYPRKRVISVALGARPDVPNAARLGIGQWPISEGLAALISVEPNKGVLVNDVAEGTAAEKAGMTPGMIILSVDGVPTPDGVSLLREVNKRTPGQTVSFEILEVTKNKAGLAHLLREAAASGNAHAMTLLGAGHAFGSFAPKDDAEAVRWYRRAAEKGEVGAMSILGSRYATGRGVPEDHKKAVGWLRKAAEKGNKVAMHTYGWMLSLGRGVRKDDAEALRWYRKAAAKGYPGSMWNLAIRYEQGDGVPKDSTEALNWYRKAAELGHGKAIERLRDLGVSLPKAAKGKPAPDLGEIAKDLEKLD